MICKNCGSVVKDGMRFCSQCGAPMKPDYAHEVNPEAEKAELANLEKVYKELKAEKERLLEEEERESERLKREIEHMLIKAETESSAIKTETSTLENNSEELQYCPFCGAHVGDMKYCAKCGRNVREIR